MTQDTITSAQNPKIRRLLQLQQKSSERRREGLFVVEGQREIMHCLSAGYEVDTLFFCISLIKDAEAAAPLIASCRSYAVSEDVYARIAYRATTEGMVAEMRSRHTALYALQLSEHPLIAVLESVEKPGNLGAVLRSADAAGADAVIVCDPLTDLFNPNLIRSSLGAVFTVPCVACTTDECIDFLRKKDIAILTAQLQDSSLYYETDMRRGTAIVIGTESTGLTEAWRRAADAHIRIPMLGSLDSLNASVSAAILLFEAVRQRKSRQ
jgi:TrmH family RNA methyltransferase